MPPSSEREIWILVSLVIRVMDAVRGGRGGIFDVVSFVLFCCVGVWWV